MVLEGRQNGDTSTDRFLNLIADPFQAQVRCLPLRYTFGPKLMLPGPTKLHLRRHSLLLRRYRPPICRLLLSSTTKLARLCASSKTCRRQTSTHAVGQHAIQLVGSRQERERAGPSR